jgi:hypothetical protein
MLVKNAPPRPAANAVWRYLLTTLSYTRRDVVAPVVGGHRPRPTIVWRRAKSFASFLRLLPRALAARRRIRGAATVGDAELAAWQVRR